MDTKQRIEFLRKLRAARSEILRDAEAFHVVVGVIEHLGQTLTGKIGSGLGDYKDKILEFARQSTTADPEAEQGRQHTSPPAALFEVVRNARNSAVHDGVYARHLATRLVDLLLILEDAMRATLLRVDDLMVRNPVTAEPWHLLGHVRQTLLANSFTFLPIQLKDGDWRVVSDTDVLKALGLGVSNNERRKRLSMTVEDAMKSLETPHFCSRGTLIGDLDTTTFVVDADSRRRLPLLVLDENNRLVGMLTAFDLL